SLAGRDERAVAVAERAQSLVDDPLLRGEIARVLGVAQLYRGRPLEGHRLMLAAVRELAAVDSNEALELLVRATEAGVWASDAEGVSTALGLAGTLPVDEENPRALLIARLLTGLGGALSGDVGRGASLLEEAIALGEEGDDPQRLYWAGVAALYLGDDGRAIALYCRAAAAARTRGALTLLASALSARA